MKGLFPLEIYNLVTAEISVNECVLLGTHTGIKVSARLVMAQRREQ